MGIPISIINKQNKTERLLLHEYKQDMPSKLSKKRQIIYELCLETQTVTGEFPFSEDWASPKQTYY